MQQDEVLNRYRQLRAISSAHHDAALDYLAPGALMERAKQLGIVYARTVITDSPEELTLVYDLAVHTSKPGRSRAIDRYAAATAFAAGSDEAHVLGAIRGARFSIWRVERRHDLAGLVVTDFLQETEAWLIDEGLTFSAPPGTAFAGRLCWPAAFAMTCGVVVPVDADLLVDILREQGDRLRRLDPRAPADPRLATSIYRTAIRLGVMNNVVFQNPDDDDGAFTCPSPATLEHAPATG